MPPVRGPLGIGVDDAPVHPPLELATHPHSVQGISAAAQLGRQGGGGYPWFGFGFVLLGLLDHDSREDLFKFLENSL
jgi:hypothetical protein